MQEVMSIMSKYRLLTRSTSFCRFSYEGRWRQKLQTSVDFPLDSLDLAQYVIGPKQNLRRYNLYAVSVSRDEAKLLLCEK